MGHGEFATVVLVHKSVISFKQCRNFITIGECLGNLVRVFNHFRYGRGDFRPHSLIYFCKQEPYTTICIACECIRSGIPCKCKEFLAQFLDFLFTLLLFCLNLATELFKHTSVLFYLPAQLLATVKILLAQNVLGKVFDILLDVPVASVVKNLLDISDDLGNVLLSRFKVSYEFVNSIFEQLLAFDRYLHVAIQVEFPCHSAKYALEE